MDDSQCIDCKINMNGKIDYVNYCLDCNGIICDKCSIYYFSEDRFRCKKCTIKCPITPLQSKNQWDLKMGFFKK
jgi:hypothetical protein